MPYHGALQTTVSWAPLEPTNYHLAVCAYLEQREPELWNWIAASRQEQDPALRLHLLKTTYQLSQEAHPALHAAVAQASQRLNIAPEVALYQANHAEQINVAIYVENNAAHIIFSGAVLELLDDAELSAVIGHELAHYELWQRDGGRFWIASRLVERLADEEPGRGEWHYTALRYQQYMEIYADRGAYRVCQDIAPCIASLVKIQTGLKQVHVDSYLEQAERILAHDGVVSDAVSHPQAFIRAKALAMHAAAAPELDATLDRLLAGAMEPDTLDITGQVALAALTRSVVASLLTSPWFASDAVKALARRYWDDFTPGEAAAPQHLGAVGQVLLPDAHKLDTYLSFVLLDFACVDPTLEELPMAAALQLADQLGIGDTFETTVLKETRLKKTAPAKLRAMVIPTHIDRP
ncbi:Zn-dependent protease with chaperone function [Duganella sacchari]|uniref:Zn-dependent protease with chaperone function n=1 Tax=Duganella sacchari TaxID=551987 RepID=A0A1M7MZV0_9BURK|nr:Zn-dependent protease with chaperone function [Duganella sacchari]